MSTFMNFSYAFHVFGKSLILYSTHITFPTHTHHTRFQKDTNQEIAILCPKYVPFSFDPNRMPDSSEHRWYAYCLQISHYVTYSNVMTYSMRMCAEMICGTNLDVGTSICTAARSRLYSKYWSHTVI